MAELIINNKDAFQQWGVRMGDGFLDTIDAPNSMKAFVENESRLEHGKRVIVENPKVAAREITLGFHIQGYSESDYQTKKRSFFNELEGGTIHINVPALGEDVYKLIYLGKSITYNLTRNRTSSKISAKFIEPNPKDRTIE